MRMISSVGLGRIMEVAQGIKNRNEKVEMVKTPMEPSEDTKLLVLVGTKHKQSNNFPT